MYRKSEEEVEVTENRSLHRKVNAGTETIPFAEASVQTDGSVEDRIKEERRTPVMGLSENQDFALDPLLEHTN